MDLSAKADSRVPLLTSLPPRLVRPDRHGCDRGSDYQVACVNSWINAGFRPITVNGPGEQPPCQDLMEVVRTTRTAEERFGKPVVFIDDVIEIATSITSGPIVIVNADIVLNSEVGLANFVQRARADQAYVARRFDVETPEIASGQTYQFGIDLLAVHACKLTTVPRSDFALGLPWWDFFVPVALAASGLAVGPLPEGTARHLTHAIQWDKDLWYHFGAEYAELLSRLQSLDPAISTHLAHCGLIEPLTSRVTRWGQTVDMMAKMNEGLGRRLEKKIRRPLRKALTQLAAEAVSLVCSEQAWPGSTLPLPKNSSAEEPRPGRLSAAAAQVLGRRDVEEARHDK